MKRELLALAVVLFIVGCIGPTFEEFSTSSRKVDLPTVGTYDFTARFYWVDHEVSYYVMYTNIEKPKFDQMLNATSDRIVKKTIDGNEVYALHSEIVQEDTPDAETYSLMWYENGALYIIGTDAQTRDYTTMVNLYRYYTKK
jgi:hypothetical protein